MVRDAQYEAGFNLIIDALRADSTFILARKPLLPVNSAKLNAAIESRRHAKKWFAEGVILRMLTEVCEKLAT